MEYDGYTKAAYYAVRRAYARSMAGLRYSSLIQPANQETELEAYADMDKHQKVCLRVSVMALDGSMLYETQELYEDMCSPIRMTVRFTLPELENPVYLVRLHAASGSENEVLEEYFFTQREDQPLRPLLETEKPEIVIARKENTMTLSNVGDTAAVYLYGLAQDEPHALLSDNGMTLLPGEMRSVCIYNEVKPAV